MTQATESGTPSSMVLTMVRSDRMAGSIPVWSKADAAKPPVGRVVPAATAGAPFGFHDLVNIVNPLQHIPGISQIYRHFTGDTIHPASQVLGDTLFGGVLGAVASFVNMVSTEATGKSVPGVALAMAEGKSVNLKTAGATGSGADAPSALLAREQHDAGANGPDASTVLRFSDLGGGRREVYEKVSAAEDRMAGTMVRIRTEDTPAVPNVVVPVGKQAS